MAHLRCTYPGSHGGLTCVRAWLLTLVGSVLLAGCSGGTSGESAASSRALRASSEPASPSIARCDRSLSGAAGVPTAADEPLLIVRDLLFGNQTSTVVPRAVVYQDGSVAVEQPPGKVVQQLSDPLGRFVGGTFAGCALAELVAEYQVLAVADYGDPQYFHVSETIIAMPGRSIPGVASSFRVISFGSPGTGLLTAAQNQARRAVEKWVGRLTKVTDGVVLPYDGVAVVDTADSYGQPARRAAVKWNAPTPIKGACLALTGAEMTTALTAVRASFRQLPPGATEPGDVFTGTFSVRGQERQFNVMALPPALTC